MNTGTQGDGQAKVVYILYLAGLVVGVTPLIGLVMAYVARADAPAWLQTHYTYQIRTFWIGLLYGAIGMLLMVVLIGFLVLLAEVIWFIVRSVKGLQALDRGKPIEDVETWLL
ncbi:MAG: hypothetical protein O7H39_14430 [Gammaproteobacteria bacterium]|nr:hypothetical protein [Gammaproteobacteria bacterium]